MQAFVDEKIQRVKAIAVEAPIPTPEGKSLIVMDSCRVRKFGFP